MAGHISRERLVEYLSRQLSADQERQFELHFGQCRPCALVAREEFERLESRWQWSAEAHRETIWFDRLQAGLAQLARSHEQPWAQWLGTKWLNDEARTPGYALEIVRGRGDQLRLSGIYVAGYFAAVESPADAIKQAGATFAWKTPFGRLSCRFDGDALQIDYADCNRAGIAPPGTLLVDLEQSSRPVAVEPEWKGKRRIWTATCETALRRLAVVLVSVTETVLDEAERIPVGMPEVSPFGAAVLAE